MVNREIEAAPQRRHASEAARALTPETHNALVSAGVFDLDAPVEVKRSTFSPFVRAVKEAAGLTVQRAGVP